MKYKLAVLLSIFILMLSIFTPLANADGRDGGVSVGGGLTQEELDAVASIQNAVTEYALSFAGDGEVKYVWGGWGGRQYSGGENNGYWSLEQCKQYHNEYHEPEDGGRMTFARCGTDCSGFVSAVFQHFDLYDPAWGSSCSSYADSGKWYEVSDSEGRPGDIVLFKNSAGDWHHVGLYIGNGLLVDTRTSYYGENNPNYPCVMPISWKAAGDTTHIYRAHDFDDPEVLGTAQGTTEEIALQIGSAYISECDLAGMVDGASIQDTARHLELASRDDLSKDELLNVEKIKEMKDSGKITIEKVTLVVQTALGIFVLAYALVLFAGFLFDRVNTAFDISLVTLFSFGYIKIAQRDDYDKMLRANGEKAIEKGYMTIIKFLIIEAILVGIGSALVSGVVFYLIIKLLSLIGVY